MSDTLPPVWKVTKKGTYATCPLCGRELYPTHHEGTFAYPECTIWHCTNDDVCSYESDPE